MAPLLAYVRDREGEIIGFVKVWDHGKPCGTTAAALSPEDPGRIAIREAFVDCLREWLTEGYCVWDMNLNAFLITSIGTEAEPKYKISLVDAGALVSLAGNPERFMVPELCSPDTLEVGFETLVEVHRAGSFYDTD